MVNFDGHSYMLYVKKELPMSKDVLHKVCSFLEIKKPLVLAKKDGLVNDIVYQKHVTAE